MNKWNDIETAPKDGTHILTVCAEYSSYSVRSWEEGEDEEMAWLPRIRGIFPSHWMELPPLPTMEEKP